MKLHKILFINLFLVSLVGCGTPAVIKKVQDKPVEDLSAPHLSKPIQFTKVVVKLKRGEHVGAVQGGLACIAAGDLTWKGGRLNLDSEEFTEVFKEELEKYSFKTVGDPNALFDDPSSWKAEILVAGLVTELKSNICFPYSGFGNYTTSSGEAFLKVEWQIYSQLDRSVVHKVVTEGSSESPSSSQAGGGNSAIFKAFAQATRNLLADPVFRDIVGRGGKQVKETEVRSHSEIKLRTSSASPVGSNPSDWTKAVVTVYAGRGHGSGFAVSENLILTNHHVVGDSDSVVLGFDGGIELVGKVIASNSGQDVALVQVAERLPLYFQLSKSLPSVGSEVYAIGTPRADEFHATVSKGIVSAIRTESEKRLIQSDVNVLPGNSGGPLVNKAGFAVGITVSGLFLNNAPQGINFFIPINEAMKSLGI